MKNGATWQCVWRSGRRLLSWNPQSLLLLFLLAAPPVLAGQTSLTRIYGPQDQTVPTPQYIPASGQQDAAGALQAVLNFMKATGVANLPGYQGSGTLVSPTESAGDPATLTVAAGGGIRLDVTTPKGTRSTRIVGNDGEVQEENGTQHPLPLVTAADGLFAYPKLLSATFPDPPTAVLDGGTISIGSQLLHRITVEVPVAPPISAVAADNVSVIDFYFDPVSSLLVKSAVSVQLDWGDREHYVEVTTYGDYQKFGTALIPFTYSQTLNGQPQWTLQLTTVSPLPSLDSSFFLF